MGVIDTNHRDPAEEVYVNSYYLGLKSLSLWVQYD